MEQEQVDAANARVRAWNRGETTDDTVETELTVEADHPLDVLRTAVMRLRDAENFVEIAHKQYHGARKAWDESLDQVTEWIGQSKPRSLSV